MTKKTKKKPRNNQQRQMSAKRLRTDMGFSRSIAQELDEHSKEVARLADKPSGDPKLPQLSDSRGPKGTGPLPIAYRLRRFLPDKEHKNDTVQATPKVAKEQPLHTAREGEPEQGITALEDSQAQADQLAFGGVPVFNENASRKRDRGKKMFKKNDTRRITVEVAKEQRAPAASKEEPEQAAPATRDDQAKTDQLTLGGIPVLQQDALRKRDKCKKMFKTLLGRGRKTQAE